MAAPAPPEFGQDPAAAPPPVAEEDEPPAAAPPPIAPPPQVALPAVTLDGGPVTLERNERVTLTSNAAGPLQRVMLDLAWQPAPGRLSVDLDTSAIAFDATGQKLEIVWYQHQNEFNGALQHTGDAKGENSDQIAAERILVDLARMPDQVSALVFTINSFHGHTFTDLQQAFCVLSDDQGRPIVTYNLTDTQPSTAVLMAIVRRIAPGVWQMRAIGEYHDFRTVKKLVDPAARQVGIY
jgi:stress response protein SCP2